MLLLIIFLSQLLAINTFVKEEDLLQLTLFNNYNRYEEITKYLNSLARYYPNKVNVTSIGLSYEGRPILAIKISTTPRSDTERKPIILVDAGMHGREWMAPAVALYLIHQLAQNKSNEYLIDGVDWLIIPVLNPDGYEFSHVSSQLWRKTTSKTNNQACPGVDINRNFDFQWHEYEGSRKNECAPDYAGAKPFSEQETKAFRNYVLKHQQNIELYITLHAYASIILYPWAFTKFPIGNVVEHQYLGMMVAQAIQRFRGTTYMVGQTSNLLYAVSGSSCDWMAGVVGVPLNFGIELPKDVGAFQPKASEIIPTGLETFEGFKVFYNYIRSITTR